MNIYLAPLEGITGWIYRGAVQKCFGGFDKYFIPFIKPNQMGRFSAREKKDILPEHNKGMHAVPQILTNCAEDFVQTAKKLEQYGYKEINLNVGCPSKTVVTKGRGAGFLAFPERLDLFLEEVFQNCPIDISVKTRIGTESGEEFPKLMDIYNKYPIKELIIHPRTQKDFYKNIPHMDVFEKALGTGRHKICYNGDLTSEEDVRNLSEQFPEVESIMIGRGVLADPAIARKIKGGDGADKAEMRHFHDMLYEAYCEEMSGERTVLYKMKELWFYLASSFTNSRPYAKKIKKAEKCAVYEKIIEELFASEEVI